ncbi:MAG: arginine--tRNA ligase [Xanthobacteraceae bacterium]
MRQRSHLFAQVLDRVRAATALLVAAGELPSAIDASRIQVEAPREAAHGDMATNAAMVLAKPAGRKPRELAEAYAVRLRADPLITRVEVAGPGFINLTLATDAWIEELRAALRLGAEYGQGDAGGGEPINVEYVSTNPTGPLHVGHCRVAVVGDALANLLAHDGCRVTREYYINDAGGQVDVLARSVFLRYREALGEAVAEIPPGLYPGDYLKPLGALVAERFGPTLRDQPESEWLAPLRELAVAEMMKLIRLDLASLGIHQDVFFSERSLITGAVDLVESTIDWLRERGYVYQGRLQPPKGQPVDDWEDREQTLFRSTAFGDDVDRPLRKSDGSYTYFASDIAYHKSKLDRGFRTMIDVWGADHAGYVKRMRAAVKAISEGRGDLDVKIVQLVNLLRAGEPVKMSKRSGDLITLREVVDEVGRDAVRFMMLFRKNDAALDFDLARVIEQSRDNPVFYVQYAHARGCSVLRNAAEVVPGLPTDAGDRAKLLADAALAGLDDEAELALMKRIALFPRLVEAAAAAHEPHRVAFYLYDLASEFHGLWTRGKDTPHLRFIIQNDPQMTVARLALVQGVVMILASGLRLLGVGAPEEMR